MNQIVLAGMDGKTITMIIVLVVVAVLIAIGIGIVVWGIKKANALRRQMVKIKEAASDIDVALTKRFDLLSKQYDICKGYAKHENGTLIDVAKMRSGLSEAKASDGAVDMKKASANNAAMDKLSTNINIIVERYPELKANTLFISLSNSCSDVEEHLQASRRLYNSNVSIYNQEIVVFPSSIIAHMIHAMPADFFEAEEAKKQDVKMEF
ncbi:MAG: LemA family protein [Bacilli bacterium]